MAIFSYESKFSQIVLRITYGCYLNLLWFLTSIPIITIGPSTTALYSVAFKVSRGEEGRIGHQFFAAFKSNFKQATTLWLILLVLGIVLGVDVYVLTRLRLAYTGALAVFWTLLLAIVIAACIVYTVELMYVFPLVAKVENTNAAMLKNSLLIGTHYLNCTIVVFAIHFAMFFVAVRLFTPILVFGEGLCAVASSYLLDPLLTALATKPTPVEEEE